MHKNDCWQFAGAEASFNVDRVGLASLQKDLVEVRTEGLSLEVLQRLNCRLMECVLKYKELLDRTNLVPEMTAVIDDTIPSTLNNTAQQQLRKKK